VIYPSLFVLLYNAVFALLHTYTGVQEANPALVIVYVVTALLYSLLMCLLALPIFLNKIRKYSRHLAFNLITWFLLPGIYVIIILTADLRDQSRFHFGIGSEYVHFFFMIVPYLLGLTMAFIHYRRSLSHEVSLVPDPQISKDDSEDEAQVGSRRKFMTLALTGAATASAGAFLLNSLRLVEVQNTMDLLQPQLDFDTRKIFFKCGTCSNTLFTALNRAHGCSRAAEEIATDPLAGGILNTQNQCGMLWGATLALGAESWRTSQDPNRSLGMAMAGTRNLVSSFINRTTSANCRDIADFDWSKADDVLGFMVPSLPGGFLGMRCVHLADKWTPEAYTTIQKSLSDPSIDLPLKPRSCASEVVRALGGSDEEAVMVAGMAGGIGFSGNACGALGAAIWMNTLAWCRENPGVTGYNNPQSQVILNAFLETTDSEFECSKLTGKDFKSVDDHTEFINSGGCSELIDLLAQQAV